MSDWNPGEYLKFKDERTRPSRDLCSRIALDAPARVLDLGCGPGNSTAVLRERWPKAEVIGLDSSAEMIAQARAAYPDGIWQQGDLAGYQPGAPCDVVFANAVLQWLPDQAALLPRLLGLVAPGGCLAVQVPARSAFRAALEAVALRPRWRTLLDGAGEAVSFHDAPYYHAVLAPLTRTLDLWETIYFHHLASPQGVLDWYRATGMRPYLDRLAEAEQREAFQGEVLEACRKDYPTAADGTVLMPFRRVLFVAWKQ
jgi:trans-aconitate 2-methyltransferase